MIILKRMNFGKSFVAVSLAMILAALAIHSAPLGIMVPAYFDPSSGGDWRSLDDAASRVPLIAIMNPDNGPGASQTQAYVNALANLHRAGGRIIGYVYSSYAARALTNVEADIDTYLSFYAVDGFFIDEMTDDQNTNHLAYYAAIYRYVKSKGAGYSVTGNPGENTVRDYLTERTADCLMVFENHDTNYPGFRPSDWVTRYPAQQFAQIVYDVTNSAAMSNDVELVATRHAGWIYLTDRTYGALPSYWTNEAGSVEALKR
jgi:hypothetical protein